METTTGRFSRNGLFLLLVFLAALTRQILAQVDDHGVTFLYPVGENLTFYYLDTINTTYISPFASPLLYIFCASGDDFIRSQPATPFNGSTLVLLNWTSSTPCFFDLRPDTQPGHGANTDSFTLEVDVKGQTTAGLDPPPSTSANTRSSTTSGTTSTTTPITTVPSAVGGAGSSNSPSSQSATGSASSGLSAGAAAGIGIGVGLGVILLAGAAAAWFWRRRTRGTGSTSGFPDPKNLGGGIGPVEADGGSTMYGYPNSTGHSHSSTPALGEAAEQKAAWMPGGGKVNELEHVPVPQELSG